MPQRYIADISESVDCYGMVITQTQ